MSARRLLTIRWRAAAFALAACVFTSPLRSAPPTLYSQPAHQSPVRGAPDDLLMLAGYGFAADDVVVYEALRDSTQPLRHPVAPPAQSTADLGIAEVVSTDNVPHSLTIRLPKVMRESQTYALWVRNRRNEWSEGIRINDARPHWLTPAYVYERAPVAALPRYLKVVGRNLESANAVRTSVRLIGPETVTLEAEAAADGGESLDHYVAKVALPERLRPGIYRVRVSRDAVSWIELSGQTLEVRPDPAAAAEFRVDDPEHGACKANDDSDDTPCVLRAIAAAQAAGGGTVVFAAGNWSLSGNGMSGTNGIVVPQGVNLRGAGARATTVIRTTAWRETSATFTLSGGNTVQGIRFADARVYDAGAVAGAMLRLGAAHGERVAEAVTDVVITHNIFSRTNIGIEDSGAPLQRLMVTYNEFGAYRTALRLAGNRFKVRQKFRIDDSLVVRNVFKPGSYLNVGARTGTMASEIGAGHRVDFSNNTADGAATEYLYAPKQDARGWRAAFFWHVHGGQEMVLVSQNLATCTGDKIGDGEAIAYDNNGNTFALDSARKVLRATADSVTVAGPLRETQHNRRVPIDSYYVGHWIQVGEGRGVGQVRKIESYQIDRAAGSVTFFVAPRWDVVPENGSTRIAVGREFWQLHTVANTVDHRAPLCLKSNRSDPKGGVIGLWAQAADSAIEGNRQFDTDGILVLQMYSTTDPACHSCQTRTHFVNSIEIRGNLIDGEYDWSDDCSSSGILGSLAASATPKSPPPTVSYGLSIAHNTIARADGWRGGAIGMSPSWYQGPWPHAWPLVNNALIHHNTLLGLRAAPSKGCRQDPPRPRTGISLDGSSLVWRTVLYANLCSDAPRTLKLGLRGAIQVCPPGAAGSCECGT